MGKKLAKLINTAKSLVGRPYKYGAKPSEAPRYFDCSCFIQYIYKVIGIKLPRSTIEQAVMGREIKNKNALIAGDLIFLHGTSGHYNKKFSMGIGHVVMYLGDKKVIHASSKRTASRPKIKEKGKVKIEPIGKILKRKDIIVIKRILR